MPPPPTATAVRLREQVDLDLIGLIREKSAELGAKWYVEHAQGQRGLSFEGLEQAIARWMTELDLMGAPRGATIGLVIRDPVDFTVAFLATIASGRWAAPLDPATPIHGAAGLSTALSRIQADVVCADRSAPEGIATEWVNVHGRTAQSPTAAQEVAAALTNASSGGAILASSGTTGTPKVIALNQQQLLYTARCIAEHHQFTPTDRGFSSLPLFHINAEVVGLLASLVSGASLVLDDRFHRTNFWALMADRRITWINAVPAIITRLAERAPDETVPSGIRFIRSASAPLSPGTLRAFESHTAIPVVETYGMTEAASQITANPMAAGRKPGSVGRPIGVALRIVAENGADGQDPLPADRGTVGHVEIRGPSVITAYGGGLHRERFDGDGWLRTGDLGHLDEDGFLYLDARSDDVINRGGEKVFPREVEELLLVDPEIEAASVVGEPDPVFGHVPVAYLVLRDPLDASDPGHATTVLARCRRHLESALVRSKRPVSLRVVRELPAGATGKVRRQELRQLAVPVVLECQW